MSEERKGSWIQTVSGRAYWPLDPRADEVFIEDIAHALSMLCRYTGHCKYFYSVAEHSVLVSQVVPPDLALVGLLHDAPEAYINDVAYPVKKHIAVYHEIEELNWFAVADHFGLAREQQLAVEHADHAVLVAEKNALMHPPPIPGGRWAETQPADVAIRSLSPMSAKQAFIKRYLELTKGGK